MTPDQTEIDGIQSQLARLEAARAGERFASNGNVPVAEDEKLVSLHEAQLALNKVFAAYS